MKTRRFGREIRTPSILAIKHQILLLMLEDEIGASPNGFDRKTSSALNMLNKLRFRSLDDPHKSLTARINT